MGFEIHMCYWNFTCESHVNHMGNTLQFSVRDGLRLLYPQVEWSGQIDTDLVTRFGG